MISADRFTQDILAIVAAASTIDERLHGELLPDHTDAHRKVTRDRLASWCQSSAGGNWQQFRKRLVRDGFDLDVVLPLLGSVHTSKQDALPSWAHLLLEVLLFTDKAPEEDAADKLKMMQITRELASEQTVPFGEILIPFVIIAHQKLSGLPGNTFSLLSDRADAALQGQLLRELISCAVDTLYLEFSEEYAQTQESEGDCYLRFTEQMRSARLAAFFRKYSGLARLLATLTEEWIATTSAFLHHLAVDWQDIQNMPGKHNKPDLVEAIQTELSKPIQRGHHVMALTFASGEKVVYKAGNIGLEEAYYQLLDWCNQQGIVHPFKVVACLKREDHGWEEYIEHLPCRNQMEVHHYYQRAGILLCLVYMLGGSNCFASHVLACGEHPVLIDPTILMQPGLSSSERENEPGASSEPPAEHLIYTVLHTGLLSTWQSTTNKRLLNDISGFSAPSMAPLLARQEAARHDYVVDETHGSTNVPLLNDRPQRLDNYLEDVIKGFRILYDFLLKHREDLLAETSPLYTLGQQRVRFLFRPDWMYLAMQAKLLTPASLRDGVTQTIPLEVLGLSINQREDEGETRRWWPFYKAEQQVLIRQNLPRFTMRANGTDLILEGGEKIEQCFQTAGLILMLDRLRSLSIEHLKQQVQLIQTALREPAPAGRTFILGEEKSEDKSLKNEELIAQALAIAGQIGTRIIPLADGNISWLTPQYIPSTKQYQLHPMEYSLYSGTSGVALFLAALENITEGAGYRQVILTAMRPLIQALSRTPASMVRTMGIGGASGLGSITYAFTRMAQFLHEPVLLENARQSASAIMSEDIENDSSLDIIAGAAGTILGLMTLYDVSPEQSILDRAVLCGQHLLRTRTAVGEKGYRVWSSLTGKSLTGFSHGAAGISYALLRLYAATGDPLLLQAAQEGIAYEDSLFSAEAGNWPDLRSHPPMFARAWCHGAPGIGLARAGGLDMQDTPQIRQDIEYALQTIQQGSLLDRDQLCCGNTGCADIMLTLSPLLSRPDLAEGAKNLVWQVFKRAQKRGKCMFNFQFPPQVYNVELFQGMAGIGYECLRLAYPDRIPSLLLWQ